MLLGYFHALFLESGPRVLIGVVALNSAVKDLEKPAISCSMSLSEVDESKRVGTLLSPGIGVHLFTRLGQLVTKMSRILSLCVGKSTISSAPKK